MNIRAPRSKSSRRRSPERQPAATSPYVFISYRRGDNTLHATLLASALADALGPDAAFLDRSSLEPGEPFPERIEQAVRTAAVVIVVIGRNWLDVKNPRSAGRRLDDANDFVRREIEVAIEWRRRIIPVLVDGAGMPPAERLPRSIAALVTAQAVELSWLDGIQRIAEIATAEAQRLNAEVRVAAGDPTPANAALRAMEMSILNQEGTRVVLDQSELDATLERLSDHKLEGAFLMPDLIYAIDLIGVKARRGSQRYVARSKAITSLDALVASLRRGRTVLAGLNALDTWWTNPSVTREAIQHDPRANIQGGLLCIVSGWQEARREFEVHTFYQQLGRKGVVTLTFKAAQHLLNVSEMRVIDAAPMPIPFSEKATRDLKSRLPRQRSTRRRRKSAARRRS